MKSRAPSTLLMLAGILLLAVNLRPAAVSVGPVLKEIDASLQMSDVGLAVLTALPVLAFAFFGALAPAAARALGLHRVTLLSLCAVAVGLFSRSLADSGITLLLLSALALSGMAMANVLLPSLIKLHFPHRIGTVTALYTTCMALGLTAALTLTVPISHGSGGWRTGLGVWGVLAVIAAVPWLGLVRHDRAHTERHRRIGYLPVLRTRLGLAMPIFFGLQSTQAYIIFNWFSSMWRDNGYTATEAGLLVGLIAAVSIPLSLVVPTVAARVRDPRPLIVGIIACYPFGYAALLIDPHDLAIPATLLIGIGTATFPLALVLIGLRTRTPDGTAALSSVSQSVGYVIAFFGPFGFGVLHGITGGWTLPLAASACIMLPMLIFGLLVGRPAYLEDQLEPAPDDPGSERAGSLVE